jgi:outer membrane protein TolC
MKMNMSYFRMYFLLLCFGLLLERNADAQQQKRFNPLTDDITQIMPPLATLLDSAFVHDPGLKFTELQYVIDKGNLHTSQAQWTQDLGLQANAGYGTFDYVYSNTAQTSTPQASTSRQSQSQYAVGGFLRLPLYDLVNRKNQIKMAKAVMEQSKTLSETRKNELRELVIKQYNDIIAKQRVLKIKSKYLETSRINTQMAEKGFVKGTVSVDDYSRVSEIGAHTETDFETAKMDFVSSYMIMEVITGMKFNITNYIPQENESN